MTGTDRRWQAFGVLALIEFVTVMDAAVVNIALPTIGTALGFSPLSLAWVIDGYLVGLAGFMLLAGRATDFVGRRRLFVAGVEIFTVFSVACAAASEPWHLITSRVLQGFGAALAMPAALALISDIFEEGPARNKAIGIFSGMGGIAAPVGLVLGGLLTTVAWEWIFLVNVPIGLAVVVSASRLLPSAPSRGAGEMDTPGAAAFTGGLILLILATLRGSAQGWDSPTTVGEYGLSGILLAGFVSRQFRARTPLIPRELLRKRTVLVGNTAFVLVGTILLSGFFLITLYLQQVRQYDALEASLVYLPVPVAALIGTQVAPRIMWLGPHNVLLFGLVIQAAALAVWAVLMSATGSILTTFAVPATVWAVGLGVSIVSSFVICTMGVPQQLAGAASGLATTAYQGGGAIGLAVLVLVADNRTQQVLDGTGIGESPAALVSGYSAALWVAAIAASVGALLTRLLSPDRRNLRPLGLYGPGRLWVSDPKRLANPMRRAGRKNRSVHT